MKRTAALFAPLVLLALSLSGCGAQPGQTLMTYTRGSDRFPPMNMVRHAGIYALYPSDGANPITTKDLAVGDAYGFEKGADGKVAAVVMTDHQHQEIPLTARLATAYYWKYQKK